MQTCIMKGEQEVACVSNVSEKTDRRVRRTAWTNCILCLTDQPDSLIKSEHEHEHLMFNEKSVE